MSYYTDRADDFQITDVTYFGRPPKDTQPEFAIVKWYRHDPPLKNVTVIRDDQVLLNQTVYESNIVVAFLRWKKSEEEFYLESVGMRWLEKRPTEAVVQMVLDFAEKKGKEIREEEEYE